MGFNVFGDILVAHVTVFIDVVKVLLNQSAKLAIQIWCAYNWLQCATTPMIARS
jgi:hypothetical protein